MSGMDLEKLVIQPTWRDMLVDLVIEEKLDPWNIDITEVTEKYMDRIRGLQSMDLRVPANIILAAAILLRFKSDTLKLEEEFQMADSETYISSDEAPVEVPMLSLRTRIPPKRRVSLGELIGALTGVIEAQKRRAEKIFHPKPIMSIEIPKEDIEQRMNDLLSRLGQVADAEGVLMFSELLEKRSAEEIVFVLLPLLHLAQDRKIDITQEKMFGEIFITILREKNGRKGSKENN
ncbi:MAG: ScpA family protein [Candidatus Micrarchaeota archaeon]